MRLICLSKITLHRRFIFTSSVVFEPTCLKGPAPGITGLGVATLSVLCKGRVPPCLVSQEERHGRTALEEGSAPGL